MISPATTSQGIMTVFKSDHVAGYKILFDMNHAVSVVGLEGCLFDYVIKLTAVMYLFKDKFRVSFIACE
jgi:hypothetical protein